MMMVDTCYTSCGCNKTPLCLDWGQNNLICYGAGRAVAVCKSKSPCCVLKTLVAHTDRVNCVRWIRTCDSAPETELVSGSCDKTAIVWQRDNGALKPIARLTGHASTVTIVEPVYIYGRGQESTDKPRTLVATASVDSTVKIWERPAGEKQFDCRQTINFGSGFALALSWIQLPSSEVPLLACAGDDQEIRLFVEESDKLAQVQTLSGHEDWVRDLDFAVDDGGDLLLASCAQDFYIRIWRLSPRDATTVKQPQNIMKLGPEEEIKLKENTFTFNKKGERMCYAVMLESVLRGHEHWVYSIRWQLPTCTDSGRHQPMCLLSASMDKTMILWKPDADSGVWVDEVRVGEVGGNTLGFYGAVFSPDGRSILAHGYQGAFHLWTQGEDSRCWEPGVVLGGHFDSIQDLAWEPAHGNYLMSVSCDQTCRLHSYWKAEDEEESCWHEIARPQIHGYDMQCLAMIDSFSFASGAEEKVLRVFQAPRNFLDNFHRLCGVDVKQKATSDAPEGASVPALGLSNKAVFQGEMQEVQEPKKTEQYSEAYFSSLSLTAPPTEENLLQNTLWPEVQKLYGHGYEVFAVACHPSGRLLASASKAAKMEHAAILLWDTSSWRQVGRLESHTLTVTQLAFSHQGQYLLSVSRDRTWTVYKSMGQGNEAGLNYTRIAFSDKKTSIHSRIIWSCDWSHDDKYFVTVSRDKKAVIWGENTDSAAVQSSCLGHYKAISKPLDLGDSVTAVSFAPVKMIDSSYLLCFGVESGAVFLYKWSDAVPQVAASWTKSAALSRSQAHHLAVKRVKFCPVLGAPGRPDSTQDSVLQLATCGADCMVKVHVVDLSTLPCEQQAAGNSQNVPEVSATS